MRRKPIRLGLMPPLTDLIEQNTNAARQARYASADLLQTSKSLAQLISGFELYKR